MGSNRKDNLLDQKIDQLLKKQKNRARASSQHNTIFIKFILFITVTVKN